MNTGESQRHRASPQKKWKSVSDRPPGPPTFAVARGTEAHAPGSDCHLSSAASTVICVTVCAVCSCTLRELLSLQLQNVGRVASGSRAAASSRSSRRLPPCVREADE